MSTLTRKRAGAVAVALVMAGSILAPVPAFAAEAPVVKDDPIHLGSGHIDAFNLVLNEDDTVGLTLKEDVTGSHVLRTPESVKLHVKEQARTQVPENFVPGLPSDVYFLPLTQDYELIWPGWDSMALNPVYGNSSSADVDINITDVQGPGDVFLWTSGSFGAPAPLLDDVEYQLPGTIHQSILAHVHANWAFTEAGTYTLTVDAHATHPDGAPSSQSNTSTYTFVVGSSLEITGLRDHYHQNTPIVLTAAADFADEGASYRWYLQRKDQAEPVLIEGQNGAELSITAEQALDDAKVTAEILGARDEVLATAEPVTVDINDHGQPPLQKVTVSGIADHYHTGGTASLTANVAPASVLGRYEWRVKKSGETAWTAVEGENGAAYSFPVTSELQHAQVKAALTFDDGTDYVESAPVEILIDDHHDHEDPDPVAPPFTDVKPGDQFYTHISWMYHEKLSVGVKQNDGTVKYLPASDITRGALATMMVRYHDPGYQPKASLELPFKDVKKSDTHYRGIAWMYENGYAAKADSFNAANPVTRGAMATFLYRMENGAKDGVTAKAPYNDVTANDVHAKGIAWMAAKGYAASGPSNPKFNAGNSVTRGAMSAFLYRIYAD